MSEKEQLLDELKRIYEGDAWHGDSLSEILSGITSGKALGKPIPAAHTIWELVLHITGWNETFSARLAGNVQVAPADGDFPTIADTSERAWQAALQRLRRSHEQLLELIRKQDEGSFSRQFADRDYTLSFFVHGIVRHIVYHSGQIAILKKFQG
jgi:uncharacterized damage-inducible protein DinB